MFQEKKGTHKAHIKFLLPTQQIFEKFLHEIAQRLKTKHEELSLPVVLLLPGAKKAEGVHLSLSSDHKTELRFYANTTGFMAAKSGLLSRTSIFSRPQTAYTPIPLSGSTVERNSKALVLKRPTGNVSLTFETDAESLLWSKHIQGLSSI